jgi:acetoin utilization protein AcuB
MRVQEIMRRRVESIGVDESTGTAAERMRQKRIRHLVAMRDGRVAGVVSDRDLRGLAADGKVEDVMSAPAISVPARMTVRSAANQLRGRTIGCLPVVEEGRLVGIVTTSDLLELIGRGAERPVGRSQRWILKGRGPRRKSVFGRKGFAGR